MPITTNNATTLAVSVLLQWLMHPSGDLLLQSTLSHVFAMASSSRCFHVSGLIGSASGGLSPAEYAQTFFFQFLQPISHFGLYLGNENQPSGTFRLGICHILFYFDIDNIDIKFWLIFRSLPETYFLTYLLVLGKLGKLGIFCKKNYGEKFRKNFEKTLTKTWKHFEKTWWKV